MTIKDSGRWITNTVTCHDLLCRVKVLIGFSTLHSTHYKITVVHRHTCSFYLGLRRTTLRVSLLHHVVCDRLTCQLRFLQIYHIGIYDIGLKSLSVWRKFLWHVAGAVLLMQTCEHVCDVCKTCVTFVEHVCDVCKTCVTFAERVSRV